jgi:hypothetical protein
MLSKARRLLNQIKHNKSLHVHHNTNNNNELTRSNALLISSVEPASTNSDNDSDDPLLFLSKYTSNIEPLNIDELINDDIALPQHSATTKAGGMKNKFFTKELMLNQCNCDDDNDNSITTQCPMSTSDLPLHKGIMFKSCKRMQSHKDKVEKMKEKYVKLHSFSERVKSKFMHNMNKYDKVEKVVNELIALPMKVIEDDEVQDVSNAEKDNENEIVPRRKLDLIEIEMLMS